MYLNLMRTRQNWDNNSYLLQTPFEANGCGPARRGENRSYLNGRTGGATALASSVRTSCGSLPLSFATYIGWITA